MSISPRYLILADGAFGVHTSKTAVGCIRFTPEQVVGVLDTVNAGKTVEQVLGFGGAIPVVASVAAGMPLNPNILLIGIAPTGGQLPESWRPVLRAAIDSGLHVWSGLHFFIGDDPEFAELAQRKGVTILDVRKPPAELPVSSGRVRDVDATVILTVGSDCNIRSEERRVGKECIPPCRSRWSPYH